MKNTSFIWVWLLMVVGLGSTIQSCTNSKGATTGIGKAYHNLTGRYNAYYNGGLRLYKSYEALNSSYQDNYNKLLTLYPYAAIESASAANSDLDVAITKSAKNIELHRPSNWLDNSYLMMGEAEFLKQDYEKAAATFKYIIDKFNPEAVAEAEEEAKKKKKRKKRKKRRRPKRKKKKKKPSPKDGDEDEEETPEKYGVKHRPIYHEAMLWLAKTYVEMGEYDEGQRYLRLLENDGTTPYKLRGEVYAVMAHSFIRQEAYDKAIEPLETAIELTKRKKIKNRYVYVLAQLYQMQGNSELAMENFRKVLKLRPTYEMEFNARLNMAKNAANVKGNTPVNPEMAIRRMIRDQKNEEYLDQLYFALAEIKLGSGDLPGGIEALKKSMAMSGNGSPQRAEAGYMLAEIYYNQEDYRDAYAYYDTTSTALSKNDERIVYVNDQKSKLQTIALSLATIELNDSLLTIANLDAGGQKEWAQRIRKEEMEAEGKKGNGGKGGPTNVANQNVAAPGTVSANKINQSNFELYNPTQRTKGKRDFKKKWGERSWADDWRRGSDAFDTGGDIATGGRVKDLPPMTEAEVTNFLKSKKIPLTEAEQQKVNDDISIAYYNLGNAYYQELGDYTEASKALKKLIEEYPKSKHELEALYLLYSMADERGNISEAQKYAALIQENYPDTDIAKVVADPEYLNAKQEQLLALNKYYDECQQMVVDRKFQEARTKIQGVSEKFGTDHNLKPRFAILEAMCIGGLNGEEEYVKALRSVVASFPKTPEEEQAQKMLVVLTGNTAGRTNNTTKPNNNNTTTTSDFDEIEETGHYIIISFDPNVRWQINNGKVMVSDFNVENYKLMRLTVSPLMLDKATIPTLVVRKFRNLKQAQDYRNAFLAQGDKFFGEEAPDYQVYYINQNNYRTILQQNSFSEYQTFFDEELAD